ncbi:MAG: hypothetical protein HGA80_04605 [Candidatus Omnitrophica bacterium]|nr:hypothetical protein [Candidatus Omnitrophota bacterium]
MPGSIRVFLAVFFAGVFSLILELSLLREFVYIFGSTARSNAVIISVFLVGLAAGSYAGTLPHFRVSPDDARVRFRQLQTLGILYVFFLYATKWYFIYHCQSPALVYVYFLAMVLVPSFMSGLGYALVVRILHVHGEHMITWLYGVSTLGSVIGGLAHGLLLVPLWGMRSAYLTATLAAALAGWSMGTAEDKRRQVLGWLLAAAVVLAIVADPFRRFMYSPRVLFSQDSEFGIVEVWRLKEDYARLSNERIGSGRHPFPGGTVIDMKVNNVHQSYNLPADRYIHEDWARTSLDIVGRKAKVLLLGYASGVTASAYLDYPQTERLDITENCDPIIAAGRRFFPHEYARVMSDPRARLVVDDFRGYVRFAREKYDIIALDHSIQDPYQIGFFTTDFFRQLKDILAEDGVVILLGDGLSWNTTRLSFRHIYRNNNPAVEPFLQRRCLYLTDRPLRPAVSGDYKEVLDPPEPGGLVYSDDRVWRWGQGRGDARAG